MLGSASLGNRSVPSERGAQTPTGGARDSLEDPSVTDTCRARGTKEKRHKRRGGRPRAALLPLLALGAGNSRAAPDSDRFR